MPKTVLGVLFDLSLIFMRDLEMQKLNLGMSSDLFKVTPCIKVKDALTETQNIIAKTSSEWAARSCNSLV